MSNEKLVCYECVKNNINQFTNIGCDCIITENDYYAAQSLDECWCDDTSYICDKCSNIGYAKFNQRLIEFECTKCHVKTTSCCQGGFYLENKMI